VNIPRTHTGGRCSRLGAGRVAARTLLAFVAVPMLGLVATASASDYPRAGLFDRAAIVNPSGLSIEVGGGGNVCSKRETLTIHVTVSQHATGAVAVGSWSRVCTGRPQRWHATAHASDGIPFTTGCGIGTAVGITRNHGRPDGAHQWLTLLTLTNANGTNGTSPTTSC
jgi:hypothetical protein